MGTLAVGLAPLRRDRVVGHEGKRTTPLLLTLITAAMAFVAFAIPLQARAAWIPVGGRCRAGAVVACIRNVPLRAMGCVLLSVAVGRLVVVDTPFTSRELFVPFVNPALPRWWSQVLTAAEVSRRFFGLGYGGDRVVQAGRPGGCPAAVVRGVE
jgi:hypothetical protein